MIRSGKSGKQKSSQDKGPGQQWCSRSRNTRGGGIFQRQARVMVGSIQAWSETSPVSNKESSTGTGNRLHGTGNVHWGMRAHEHPCMLHTGLCLHTHMHLGAPSVLCASLPWHQYLQELLQISPIQQMDSSYHKGSVASIPQLHLQRRTNKLVKQSWLH